MKIRIDSSFYINKGDEKINTLNKSLENIKIMFQQFPYTLSNLEYARHTLKITLNNDSEYERLSNLVNAEHNIYDRETEIYLLHSLSRALLIGFKSTKLKSAHHIQHLSLIIDKI